MADFRGYPFADDHGGNDDEQFLGLSARVELGVDSRMLMSQRNTEMPAKAGRRLLDNVSGLIILPR